MSKFDQMSWGKEDSESGGIRGRVGKWPMKQALRLIPVEQLRTFHWYPNGYTADDQGKQHIVISDDPVEYWSDFETNKQSVFVVRHNEDGILGLFWLWTEARDAASLLSQEYEDYHFREHALNEDEQRVQIAEDKIEGLEKNLRVESVPLYKEFNYEEWSGDSYVINGDNVRTFEDILMKDKRRSLEIS